MTTTSAPELVRPAHLWVPERRGSYGDEVVDIARMAGREVDAEQALALDALCSYGPGGQWLTLETAIVEARQNGKTNGVLIPIVLADLFLWEADELAWTAHLFKTTRKAFEEFKRCIDYSSELSRRVRKISESHGEESIELMSGAVLQFLARSMGGGRGLSGKRVVFDEALILSGVAMGALVPTLATRANAQISYGSSAGNLKSDHLRSLRKRGRAGGDPSLIWVEWCDPGSWAEPGCVAGPGCSHLYGVEGCALDDESRWPGANHTLGKRISYEYVRAERRALGSIPREFGRERMGWHEDPPTEDELRAIDPVRWDELADPMVGEPAGPVALALDVPPDRSSTSIAVAWTDAGRVMVMVIVLPGTSKAVDKVRQLVADRDVVDVSLHAGGPAGALVAKLEEPYVDAAGDLHDGIDVRAVPTSEMAQATGAFLDLVAPPRDDHGNVTAERLLGHLDQLELNAAVHVAETRKMGDAKMWARDDLTNLAPLIASTLAAHGFVKHASDVPPADIF